jgi:hypothetical protein
MKKIFLTQKKNLPALMNQEQDLGMQMHKRKGEHIWTDIYLFETDKLPGLTYSTPIFYKETLKGVIGIDISIKGLSYFLGEQKIGKSGKAFFINKQYQIVAHPLLKGEKFHAIDEKAMDEEDHEIVNSIHCFQRQSKRSILGGH